MSDHSELKKAAEACRFASGVALIGARVQFHALANPSVVLGLIAEIKARTMFPNTTMGVGSGDGRLFVHGDYDSIKAAQAIVIERDQLKAEVEALRKDSDIRKWQTMESCPHHKDVIFYREDAGVFSGKLTCADEFMSDSERDEGLLTEEEQFALDAWSYEPEGIYRLDGDLVPTHWMPYPCDPELTQ